jgi:hypothetical protein
VPTLPKQAFGNSAIADLIRSRPPCGLSTTFPRDWAGESMQEVSHSECIFSVGDAMQAIGSRPASENAQVDVHFQVAFTIAHYEWQMHGLESRGLNQTVDLRMDFVNVPPYPPTTAMNSNCLRHNPLVILPGGREYHGTTIATMISACATV